jgi:hypothetical protein
MTTAKRLETYRNPTTLDTNTLRYTFDRTSKTHAVRHDTRLGQEAPASLKKFHSIHMAEAEMVRLRALLAGQGYTERVK